MMERHDIKMITNAWGKYFDDAHRGCWMPVMGTWHSINGWIRSGSVLATSAGMSPAPLVCVVASRIHDIPLEVTINYRTAVLTGFDTYNNGSRQYKEPAYAHSENKTTTFTIPAFTDIETIFRICPDDNLIYDITSVSCSSHRYDEMFAIFALASPTSRILYAQGWHNLYENIQAMKRGIWSAPTPCPTCQGTGLRSSVTCPECEGWGFSGANATVFLLDKKGGDVGVVRNDDSEDDEAFRKRVWAKKWWVIPTLEEIKRYFMHFCHVQESGILVYEYKDAQQPTFFVCIDPSAMGGNTIWAQDATYQQYDQMVENICPAGVNGFFSWLISNEEDLAGDGMDDDSSSSGIEAQTCYGNIFDGSEFGEAMWVEADDWSSENLLDGFGSYLNDDDIATESPELWELIGGSFKCVRTGQEAQQADFEWHDVGTFVPEDDPRELWEIHNSLVVELFTNFTDGDDISAAPWTVTGTDGSLNTFKAAQYYSIHGYFLKTNTSLAMDAKLTFPVSHDMSHKGWFDGDGVRLYYMLNSYANLEYSITRADGTDMICVRFNASDGKIEVLDNTTWTDTGVMHYLDQTTIDVYYQSETTFIVVIAGSPIGSSTPTAFTNKNGASWAGGNCASVHFNCATADTAQLRLYHIATTWEQDAGDEKTGLFTIEEQTYGGLTHKMLKIAWSGVMDNNQEMRVQFPAPIATLSNHVIEFDWLTVGGDYQHFCRFYNSDGDCVQEIDGYNATFYLLAGWTNESNGSWQQCGFTPELDTVSYNKYYRLRITYIDNTHFKMDVYDYATSTWHMGADLTYFDSTTAANLDRIAFTRQVASGLVYKVSDMQLSWLPLEEAEAGYSRGELKFDTEDGEVIGTFPVESGTVFGDYRAKLYLMFLQGTEDYHAEIGIAEDGNEADADLNIQLVFKNDYLIYNRWGIAGEEDSTGITWYDPDPDGKVVVEKFDGFDNNTSLDDSDDWAPYTDDDSDGVNYYANFLNGKGVFRIIPDEIVTVSKLYTLTTSPTTGIINVFAEYDASLTHITHSTKFATVIATITGPVPALWFVVENNISTGMKAYVYNASLQEKEISNMVFDILYKFKFELDMDNQTFKIYQMVNGAWVFLNISEGYNSFWGSISAGVDTMLFSLDNGPSTVLLDNIGTDWDTEIPYCDAEFEVSVVAADNFRLRKNKGPWTEELTCKNTFVGGIKHIKLKTAEVDGIQVDDIVYSW